MPSAASPPPASWRGESRSRNSLRPAAAAIGASMTPIARTVLAGASASAAYLQAEAAAQMNPAPSDGRHERATAASDAGLRAASALTITAVWIVWATHTDPVAE